LRRRGIAVLEPAIFEPEFEQRLIAAWCRYGAEGAEPATALAVRARIERYATRTPRERAALVCTSALRPVLADFLLRSGIRVAVYAYGELPNEMALVPAEVIAQEETNALASCT
jgi:flagellar biosynthesis component FlhA